MKSGKLLHVVTFSLLLVGGLNWGLVGFFNFDLVQTLLGSWPMAVQVVYSLVGLSTVYVLFTHASDCKMCSGKKK